MSTHALRQIIEACDKAITARDFDLLMTYYAEDAALVVKPGLIATGKENIRKAFVAISDYFQGQLVVEQGEMQVIEGAGNTIRFTGACSGLRIEGASNIVTVDLAPGAVIRVEGASNEVSWSMPGNARPRQTVEGAANRISRAR